MNSYLLIFTLFLFLLNCNSIDENKSSKFKSLWKEPADPPPQSDLLPESNTTSPPKKK